jgi:uncharacterized protein (DUF3820 family)
MKGIVSGPANLEELLLKKSKIRKESDNVTFTKAALRNQNQNGNYSISGRKSNYYINLQSYKLMFGKHTGIMIHEVPVSYLRWMIENVQLNDKELSLVSKIVKSNIK